MSSPERSALVLVGPMGSGKTSVGKRVARALGWSFTDTDAMVVRENGPLPELFATRGEAHFRALERDAVSRALQEGGVVSLGGGAVLDPHTRSALAAHRVVLLTVAPHVVVSRIGGTGRPLLNAEDPLARWERILEERRPLYEEVADATFDTSSGPLSRVVQAIVAWAQAPLPPSSPAQAGIQETL